MDNKLSSYKLKIPAPTEAFSSPIYVPDQLLMGVGASNCAPRVLKALGLPIIGHMHKEFFKIMDEVKCGLQYLFQTENPWTMAISGSGNLAMEAILVNLLEPGETLLVGVNGIWGQRAADVGNRIGAMVISMEKELGGIYTLQEIESQLIKHSPKVFFITHGESSTGVLQPLEGVGDLCQRYGCLLAVDTVSSLGSVPFYMDEWKVDAVYAAGQKALGALPGLSPLSFGPRAVEKIKCRESTIKSFYLDMNLLSVYWACNGEGKTRTYHHTAAVNLYYGLREALADLVYEGLENVWKRQAENTQRLHHSLSTMGYEFFISDPAIRLPMITTIKIPNGLDWEKVVQYAMEEFSVGITGGLGPSVGKVFRIAVMSYNAQPEKVDRAFLAFHEGVKHAKAKPLARP